MSLDQIKQTAQAIIDASYKNNKDRVIHLTKELRKKVIEERKKYV